MRQHVVLSLLIGTLGLAAANGSQAREPLKVVTSFSVLADMVERVGGGQVTVSSLVGPDSDSHVYSPSPADARQLAKADLVVFNGLQFEGWMSRLIDAGNYQGTQVIASDGIDVLAFEGHDHGAAHTAQSDDHEHGHHHGDSDPHAWLDVSRAEQYVVNIRDGLIDVDPSHADGYRQRTTAYLTTLDALDDEIRTLIAEIPADQRSVVTSHDAFEYFGDAYDVRFLSPVGLNTAAEPAAAELARLVDFIHANRVPALFYENITSPALIRQLAEEADLPIAGTLYSGALASDGEAASYVGMMRHNARVIHDGLSGVQTPE